MTRVPVYEMGTSEKMLSEAAAAAERRRLREETATVGGPGVDVGPPGGTDSTLAIYPMSKGGFPQIAKIWMEKKGNWDYPFIVQEEAGR
eukprot:2030448-Heterocapsa_arctica.AAC.1